MILGMTPILFIHVLLSLVGIFAGIIVVLGMLANKRLSGLTSLFLWTTVLTSATGYLLPAKGLMPSHIVGFISLVALIIAIVALYTKRLVGGWRKTYVVTAVIALYLNVFVLIAQLFGKVPALHALAPTGTETPFKIAQGVNLLVFVLLGIGAARSFHSDAT
jgi:hypothetical protein